ncbi:hypothetical protein BCF11_4484 [Collimonas sp. PA-H2]|uniref:hypothetical protein n=1 Tax=Collimonas sp. PA-H2 TaxID=1881062 RepID=UPI000C01D3B8|nr:hypothetical protein [Collimonas sp. PA-H2]PFH12011.1 hypothetical protein BCF11_4484 [Collimonas sp. PA-H2]
MHALTNPFTATKSEALRRAGNDYKNALRDSFFPAALPVIVFALSLGASPAMATSEYVDAVNYPGPEQGWDAFHGLEQRLVRDFDDVCGDTFCEGEFSNLQALRYRCSVRQADSLIGECIWTFAGSNAEIDDATGKVTIDARTWACRTPLAPQTPIATFYSALSVARPMQATLPATTTTIHEGLFNCLN